MLAICTWRCEVFSINIYKRQTLRLPKYFSSLSATSTRILCFLEKEHECSSGQLAMKTVSPLPPLDLIKSFVDHQVTVPSSNRHLGFQVPVSPTIWSLITRFCRDVVFKLA